MRTEAPEDWPAWLTTLFPATYTGPLARYHNDYWDWLWSVVPGVSPAPYVAVWPRGWAKSTNAEVGAVALGTHGRRHYVLYVCSKQPQADDHVTNIAMLLESDEVARYHPGHSEKWVGKFGNARGWRRNRLSTKAGFTVDGIGLDTAMRGAKLGNYRPDVIVLDDIDETTDSPETITKKVDALTKKILPAGSADVAVLVAQNLVHRHGIVSQLVDGRADFLAHRIISGPHPAIVGLEVEGSGKDARIIGGEPTWPGVMGLRECQAKIGLFGLTAFRAECQHEMALTGQPRFSLEALELYQHREPLPYQALPAQFRAVDGLRVYALPVPGVAYVVYIDPAEGKGRDYCATVVMEARSRQVVAVLEDNSREPQQHGEIACDLWEWYHRGILGFERAKGEAIALVLGQRGVDRIYEHEDNPLTPQQRAQGLQPKLRPGFPMFEHTKRGLIDRLAGHIEAHAVGIPDKRMLEQARSYVVTERMTTEAEAGGHDDLVIGLAGADMLSEQPGAQTLRETDNGLRQPARYSYGSGGPQPASRREQERAFFGTSQSQQYRSR